MFKLMEEPVDRLVGKIVRTGEYCSHNYAGNKPVSRFLFYGETDDCRAFNEYAAEHASIKIEKFSPFEDQSNPSASKMPRGAQDRSCIIPALGIAMSNNEYTPNFLYTYLQKNIKLRYQKINLGIVAACLVGVMVCTGVWGWFKNIESKELNKIKTIETQLDFYNPVVTQNSLDKKIVEAGKKAGMINRYARDFISPAVINEICSLTPEKISLISLESDFREDIIQNRPSNKKTTRVKRKKSVTIRGLVKTEFTALESALTGYVLGLGDSPLFGEILLRDKKVETQRDSNLLMFTADMEIL
ncbi:MAG: hypothetical protein GY710_10490 [Desulfobacteraceae bacterium]|nr:hypothetical protein [Desulfobacteraceae bacterium]